MNCSYSDLSILYKNRNLFLMLIAANIWFIFFARWLEISESIALKDSFLNSAVTSRHIVLNEDDPFVFSKLGHPPPFHCHNSQWSSTFSPDGDI